MFILSMKTTRARIATAAVLIGLLIAIMVLSRGATAGANASVTALDDAARREYIISLGYTPDAADAEVREVTFPADLDDTLRQYNELQQQAGFDLDAYRGKRVKCYTYAVTGLADAAVAHLYVYQGAVIGGDVSSVEAGGFCYPLTARADQGKDSGKDGTAG